jgi:hypothetical protein
VHLQHIKVYMCAIQNFHIDWIIDTERDDDNQGIGRVGEDGNLYLTSNEITFITKKYIRFYTQRSSKLNVDRIKKYNDNSAQKQKYGEEPTFTPKINPATSLLAKSREQSRSSIRVEDRLIRDRIDVNIKVDEMRQLKMQEEVN